MLSNSKAQEDPELRLLAMRIVGYLIRTELAIQHEQDQAAVDELHNDLEAARHELAEKTLRGHTDGEKYLLLLLRGETMYVHITAFRGPRTAENQEVYDYELDAVEVVD
jgi:hypothetical protein